MSPEVRELRTEFVFLVLTKRKAGSGDEIEFGFEPLIQNRIPNMHMITRIVCCLAKASQQLHSKEILKIFSRIYLQFH